MRNLEKKINWLKSIGFVVFVFYFLLDIKAFAYWYTVSLRNPFASIGMWCASAALVAAVMAGVLLSGPRIANRRLITPLRPIFFRRCREFETLLQKIISAKLGWYFPVKVYVSRSRYYFSPLTASFFLHPRVDRAYILLPKFMVSPRHRFLDVILAHEYGHFKDFIDMTFDMEFSEEADLDNEFYADDFAARVYGRQKVIELLSEFINDYDCTDEGGDLALRIRHQMQLFAEENGIEYKPEINEPL